MSVDRSALDALEPGPPPTGRGPWRAVARRFARDRAALAGAAVLAVLVVACTAGALLAPSPTDQDLALGASGPSADHWFGTDRLGRDMLARVLHGGRVSLRIGLGVAVLSGALGTAVGLVAGYRRGRLDALLMRATDLWLALPALPFLAVAVSIGEVGPVDLTGVTGMVLVLSLLLWSSIARVVRGVVLSLRERGFVEAARAVGASGPRVMLRHLLPHATGPIVVHATLMVATAVMAEAALSFLGFGIQPPTASWGNLLPASVSALETTWWLVVFPGLAIFLTVLAVNLVGEGLREALDPRAGRRSR